jgi:hypothetical protein
VALLERICGIRPADVLRRLAWNYALTPGEEPFVATLRLRAGRRSSDPSGSPEGVVP